MVQDAQEPKTQYLLWYAAQHFTRPDTLQVLPQVTAASFLMWWPPLTGPRIYEAEEQGLLALALANPTCPHDDLQKRFEKYPHVVASNPGLERADPEWFETKDDTVVAKLLGNPAVQQFPEDLDDSDVRFRQAWLSNANCPNDQLESELGCFPRAVAANPNAGELLKQLNLGDGEVRILLSRNPSTPADILEELSRNPDPRVRCGVAFTTNDQQTRELLRSDPDRVVSDTACLERQSSRHSLFWLWPTGPGNVVLDLFLRFSRDERLSAAEWVFCQAKADDWGAQDIARLINPPWGHSQWPRPELKPRPRGHENFRLS